MNGLDFGTAIGLIKGLGSPDPAVIESAVSDWLDDHPEATTTVQDGSITKAKLDSNLQGTVDDVANLKSQLTHIVSHGKNIINPDLLITSTGSIDAITGTITTTGGEQSIYGYYDLNVGSSYAISKSAGAIYIYQYNSDDTYCGSNNIIIVGGGSSSKTFVAAGAKCVFYGTRTIDVLKPQLELGSSPTNYEPFYETLNSNIKIPIIGNEALKTSADKVIPAINEVNTKFERDDLALERTYNLIDPMTIVGGYLGSSGNVIESQSAFTTDYIDVNGNDVIRSIGTCSVVCFYDSSKTFITGSSTTDTKNVTAPATAKYVRITYNNNPTKEAASTQCLYISSTEKEYVPYKIVKGTYLPKEENPFPTVEMLLPRKLAVANNVSICVNFQSVVRNWDVNLSVVKSVQNNKFHVYGSKIVINGGTNNNNITIIHRADYNVNANTHNLNILNVPQNAGSGTTKKILFIGDSKTDANVYTQKLLDMFSTDSMNIELIGTRGNSVTNRHEGRSGWSAKTYCTNIWERGVVDDSPFYNPTTQKFDFAYYMSNNGYSGVDYVFICLGTNDSESDFISYYHEMIDSIKAYDNNIIIGVWTPAPFATFGGYTHFDNDNQTMYKIEDVLNEFDNDTYEQQKIFVVPTHVNIDTFYDFPWTNARYNDVVSDTYRVCTDPIHESNGYCHDADVIFSYIKYFATSD